MLTLDNIGVPPVNVFSPRHIVTVRRIREMRIECELQVIVRIDKARHYKISAEVDYLRWS
jgi:hypothetical protein